MINASQCVDFLSDCDLVPETWGAGRSDSPGCHLNSREGETAGSLSICVACRLSWVFSPTWGCGDFLLLLSEGRVPHLTSRSPRLCSLRYTANAQVFKTLLWRARECV